MPAFRFLLALLGAIALHFVAAQVSDDLPRMFDPFLLVVVAYGLRGDLVVGLGVGMLAGLVALVFLGGIVGAVLGLAFLGYLILWSWKYRYLFWLLVTCVALQFVSLLVVAHLMRTGVI